MKKLLIGLTSLVLATGLYAQDGKVAFNNTGGGLAPVTVDGFTADNTFSVELVYNDTVLATTGILANGFFQGPEIEIPGVGGSSEAMLTVRVFKTDLGSWDDAVASALTAGSNVAFIAEGISATTGAITTPPSPAPGLGGAITAAGGFSEVIVPEPGVLALGLVGAGAFFMRRRRAA